MQIYKPAKYNTKYYNKYYLKYIFDTLEMVISYKSLMKLKSIKSSYEFHYANEINKIHLG